MASPASRVSDGFSVLDGGVNDGMAASIIESNQVAFASDFTFRGGYAKTREPWQNLLLTFDSDATKANFTGLFQGACGFQSAYGENGFIISRGGRLFFLKLGLNNVISEITPTVAVVTAQLPGGTPGLSFVVPPATIPPGPGFNVVAYVNDTKSFIPGHFYNIDTGQYRVLSIGENYLVLEYFVNAAHATVAVGTPIQDLSNVPVFDSLPNPATFDFTYLFQAENYAIVLAGQNRPVIYDGATSRLAGTGELPPGIFGIYIWGRIWITYPNRKNFVAGDLVGSSSGSPANAFVDAILKLTENTYLNGGGAFSAPSTAGPISAMAELAQLDTSLGVGNLLMGSSKSVFSVNTPVDRTTWQNLSYPIQTISLINYGPTGPRFYANVNGDLWYRAKDGIRSFKAARREINEQGNTPQSREISSLLAKDDKSLLFYGSAMLFDNRVYFTCSPYRDYARGVAHRGLAVMNLDTISNLRTKLPPEWEGVYTGLNVLQLAAVDFNEQERGFAFALNGTAVELWELGVKSNYDTFIATSGDTTSVVRTSIPPALETRAFNCGDGDQLKQLLTASIFLDELVDDVTLTFKYRPDQYPDWTTWATVSLCADVSQCAIVPADPAGTCKVWSPNKAQYAAKIILPQPENVNNDLSHRPMSWGYEHQIRIEATGHFRIRKFKIECAPQSEPTSGVLKEEQCQTVSGCDTPIFGYDAHG